MLDVYYPYVSLRILILCLLSSKFNTQKSWINIKQYKIELEFHAGSCHRKPGKSKSQNIKLSKLSINLWLKM